jgi:tetratricopeptide (TPR) repeat protein
VTAGVGLGFHLYLSQQHQPETEPLASVLELEPDSAVAHWALGLAYDRLGRFAEADASHRRATHLSGGSLTMESNLARSLALASRGGEAESLLRDLETRGLAPYRLATIEAALGRTERALAALERGLAERDPWMVWIDVDPMLDLLREHARFRAIVDGVRAAP